VWLLYQMVNVLQREMQRFGLESSNGRASLSELNFRRTSFCGVVTRCQGRSHSLFSPSPVPRLRVGMQERSKPERR
jgi:hypothetical protein